MALKGKLQLASPSSIAAIQADIASCVAAAAGIAQQAQTANSGASQASNQQTIASTSAASRAAVASFAKDYYEKKVFDPYLHFSSAEEEHEFRRREAERKEEIERTQALQTPEGNLRANTLAIDQLDDAGAHGADKSPDFATTRQRLVKAKTALEAAQHSADGRDKPEDRRAQAAASPSEAPPQSDISPDVLAALRKVSGSNDASSAGHGLENQSPQTGNSRGI